MERFAYIPILAPKLSTKLWLRIFLHNTIHLSRSVFLYSGNLGITSSIFWDWNISVIFCPIDIKLVLVKRKMEMTKNFYLTSGFADMTSLNFEVRTSFLFYVWLSHTLVRVIWVVHETLRSYRISRGSMASKIDILSLLFDLSIHNSANSWPSHYIF